MLAVVAMLAGCALIWPAKYKFEAAEELEQQGKYPEAVALYEEVFTRYPKKREALDALLRAAAIYEERLNNWQKAAAYLQDLRSRTEGKPQYASVLLRLGRVLEHAGSPFRDSIETYGVLCRNCASAPEAVSALVAKGRLHESMQDWAAAKGVYEDALARYGKSAEAPTIRVRLEAVWQFEAMGLYYAGEVEHGVTLAQEAMKKGITVDEVRNGLEALLGRYKKAMDLWRAEAASVIREAATVTDQPAPGHFVHRYERGAPAAAPAGWTTAWDAKKTTLTVTEAPPEEVSATPMESAQPALAGKPAAKPKAAPKRKPLPKPWSWKSPAGVQVLGYWVSPDGRKLGWIGKSRSGSKRSLNLVDLGSRKGWVVMTDPTGTVLGDVIAFLPHADKVIFPYENYVMVSDLRGGNRTSFPLESGRGPRVAFRGRQVDSLATTSDGLELLLVTVPPPPKKGKASAGEAASPHVYWQVGLGVGSF